MKEASGERRPTMAPHHRGLVGQWWKRDGLFGGSHRSAASYGFVLGRRL